MTLATLSFAGYSSFVGFCVALCRYGACDRLVPRSNSSTEYPKWTQFQKLLRDETDPRASSAKLKKENKKTLGNSTHQNLNRISNKRKTELNL
jgi:hypothetical protein